MSFRGLLLGIALGLHGIQAIAADDEAPSEELLEFLGSFETAQGEWIDPTDFEVPLPKQAPEQSGGKQDE